MNRAESDTFERRLLDLTSTAPTDHDADIVVINTCTVTAVAEKKTRKCVRRALKDHPRATVLVTGCAATQNSGVYEQMSDRVVVVDRMDVLGKIDDIHEDSFATLGSACSIAKEDACHDVPSTHELSYTDMNKLSRLGVKIQDGCNNACSFCIVHTLRGMERSVPRLQVIEDCERLSSAGIPEIVLTGINTGKYDSEGAKLTDLVSELLSLDLPSRLRISSIEPTDFDIELASLAENSEGMLCRHFHIPLQSGCSRVLKQMNRLHDAEFARELIHSIREVAPTASISTDIIVGFPGETEADFQETMEFCKESGFSKIHVFPYSQREGTPAAERTDQIDADTKKQRARALQQLANEMRKEDLASRTGSTELIVVESEEDSLTESYHWVKTPSGATPRSLIQLKL